MDQPKETSHKKRKIAADGSSIVKTGQTHKMRSTDCVICTVNGISIEGLDKQRTISCAKCHIAVHRSCYGYPLVSHWGAEWTCDRCEWGARKESCALCPSRAGALKRTTDWRWAHLACALWIPECFFRFPDGREPIDYLQLVPKKSRWNQECHLCGESYGMCIKCVHKGCDKTFHVTCGMAHNVYLEYKQNENGTDIIVSYCTEHARRWHGKRNMKAYRVVASK
eukprot:gb/GEZN01014098.1/.p1 GENE.gb/GEZN01014098.1/~~gb/GEZN01014098.1/.p1  ORF type:complete len:224 (+),score=0.52 gb/GEZN01014098.1/:200-871(+)